MLIENFNAGTVHLSRVPFGRSYRHFMKVHGHSIRIDKNLYREIRMKALGR